MVSNEVVTCGQAYGICSMAIDGNDIIVLYRANHIAWEMAITEGRIILIKVRNVLTNLDIQVCLEY
jgi:TPP-dependent pyruvate/acetoin dehydrogenase alpha subunit